MIVIGVLFASLSVKPLQLILLAQIANGALLPIIAIFILWVSNDKTLLGERSNNAVQNLLGAWWWASHSCWLTQYLVSSRMALRCHGTSI